MVTCWLLSHLEGSPGNEQVLAAARRRGLSLVLVDPAAVAVRFFGARPEFRIPWGPDGEENHTGEKWGRPRWVFTRMGGSAPSEALQVLRLLELAGVRCTNRFFALQVARDKEAMTAAFLEAGVPCPRSVVVPPMGDYEIAAESLAGPPWVLKLAAGAGGGGVSLVESIRSLRSVGDTLSALGQRVVVQEFVEEARGADTRVFVLGGEVLGAMRRQGRRGEFRSNLHRGGGATAVEVTDELAALASKAAAAVGLEVAGVDVVEGPKGPLVLEVNGAPGLEGLSSALGEDLADRILDHLEEREEKGERDHDE